MNTKLKWIPFGDDDYFAACGPIRCEVVMDRNRWTWLYGWNDHIFGQTIGEFDTALEAMHYCELAVKEEIERMLKPFMEGQ